MKSRECRVLMGPGTAWAAGVSGSSSVYEDAGDSLEYQRGEYVLSNLTLAVGPTTTTLTIDGGSGQAACGLPAQRRFEARFRGAPEATSSSWAFAPEAAAVGSSWWWEETVGGGPRTLVGVSGLVASDSTVTASFSHAA